MATDNGVVKTSNLASAWRIVTETVEFPSGRQVEMSRPEAISLMAESDEIPDSFFNLMVASMETGKNPTEGMTGPEMRDFLKTMTILATQIAVQHFVNPRVVTEGEAGENEITLAEVKAMSMNDKQFLMNFGMYGGEPVELLSRFREAERKRLAAAPSS
jgi:hypothetical protein